MSLMSVRLYQEHTAAAARSLERLATGKRINHAKDDPAGLIASENLGAQSTALRKEIDRLQRESLDNAAHEGGYGAVGELLQDLNGLVVRASNKGGLGADEAEALQVEADGVIAGLRYIYGSSSYNGKRLFEGQSADDLGRSDWQPPANADGTPAATESVSIADLMSGGRLNLIDGDLEAAQRITSGAITGVSTTRAALGAQQSTFYDRQISSMQRELENTEDARSKIRDTDYATEVTEYVRNQVLAEAAVKIIQIVQETSAKTVLGLLTGVGAGR